MRSLRLASMAFFVCAAVAAAQPVPDHLKCYKVKDLAPKASYTADIGGLVSHPACLVKVPGKLLCVQATKTGVTPPPEGGDGASGPAGRFLCYKVKCPKAALDDIQWHDQFGSRVVAPLASRMLCAPEIVESTTTTTSSSTTTSTVCPAGETLCGTSCVDLDTDLLNCGACGHGCAAECAGNVAATTCSAGLCSIATCTLGFFDTNGSCADGCECQDSGVAHVCAAATSLGTLGVGQSLSRIANVPLATGEDWFLVTLAAGGNPIIRLGSNPSFAFRFDVDTSCGTLTGCTQDVPPSLAAGRFYCEVASGTYRIRVYRVSGPATCDAFTLDIQN